jgi:hypothetical protein
MPTVSLRFYGRFAFVEERDINTNAAIGKITALAPSYNGSPDPHEAIMWIRRDSVVTTNGAGAPLTNLAPSHRLVSDGPIKQSECFVWDLSGRTVQVRDRQIAELPNDHGIADLAFLENDQGRAAVFDKAFLLVSKTGPISAAIRLAGTGSTGVAFPGPCDFVTLATANAGNLTAPADLQGPGGLTFQFADFVEFQIGLNEVRATARNPPLLTLDLTDPGAASFTNQIIVQAATPVTIGFSNRCATLPKSPDFDLEFAEYYKLLKNPPTDPLIPREIRTGAGLFGDCDRLAYVPCRGC